MKKRNLLTISCLAIFLCCFPAVRQTFSAPGDLDTNFGSGGKMITLLSPHRNYARRVRIQPDGKIVTLGHSWGLGGFPFNLEGSFITRHNANGTPDASFGANGVVNTNPRVLNDFVILPNGKIMAVGYGDIFSLYRYNSDGTTDNSFGVNGVVATQVGNRASAAMRIVLQPDGKIVVIGYTITENPYMGNINIARYYQDGSLDAGFGSNGVFFTSMPVAAFYEIIQNETIVEYLGEALIQPDGKLLFGLTSPSYSMSLVRINPNGTFDNTFGTNGVSSDFSQFYEDSISGIALAPDGKIVVNGLTSTFEGVYTTVVSRFNSNGTRDTSFGSGGHIVSTEQNINTKGLGATVAVQRDGRILTAGSRDGTFALSRYNLDGTIDNSFGTNGVLKTPIGNNPGLDTIFALTFQPDGKLVAAGKVRNPSYSYDLGVVRYLLEPPSGTPFDFDGDGRADLSLFRPSDQTWYLRTNRDGVSSVPFGSTTDKLVPADYDGDGKTDIAIFRNGIWAVRRSSDGANALTSFGQAGDVPVAGDYDGDKKADIAVFRPSNSVWYILRSSDNGVDVCVFGDGADKPVQGDYDGDGKTDVAVFRPSTAVWYVVSSRDGRVTATVFGDSTDNLAPADYDGDGRMDIAIFRSGVWAVRKSSDGANLFVAFGQSGDVPVPADYDGDGKADEAILRDGTWNILQSSGGISAQTFGLPGDQPVPVNHLP